jgi:hypothetical protein
MIIAENGAVTIGVQQKTTAKRGRPRKANPREQLLQEEVVKAEQQVEDLDQAFMEAEDQLGHSEQFTAPYANRPILMRKKQQQPLRPARHGGAPYPSKQNTITNYYGQNNNAMNGYGGKQQQSYKDNDDEIEVAFWKVGSPFSYHISLASQLDRPKYGVLNIKCDRCRDENRAMGNTRYHEHPGLEFDHNNALPPDEERWLKIESFCRECVLMNCEITDVIMKYNKNPNNQYTAVRRYPPKN